MVALIAVVLALMMPAAAQAKTPAEHIASYLERAEAFWDVRGGYVDCPLGIDVVWQDTSAGGAYGRAELGGCRMILDPELWREHPRWWRCMVVTHEYGHLIGIGHHERPGHIMHEHVWTWNLPWRCQI